MRCLRVVCFVLIVALVAPIGVWAHGGGQAQLINSEVAGYWVSVWTSPDPARPGDLHFSIAVSEPGTGREAGQAVLGAAVQVILQPVENDLAPPVGGLALHQNAENRLFYEVDLEVVEGWWEVMIVVDGPAGRGETTFPLQVQPPAETNWFLVGGAVVVLIFAVVMIQRSQPTPRSHTKSH